MQIFRGSPALSSFRSEKLLSQLQSSVSSISHVYAEYVHFADVEGELSAEQTATLQKLLTYGPAYSVEEPAGELLVVIPRFGTISPWASKATDIAHNCGLQSVHRLERGVAYYIQASGTLGDADIQSAKALIHDRMIEIVLNDFNEAAALFDQAEPAVGGHVDILSGGRDALVNASSQRGLAISPDEIDYLMN